MKRRVGLALGAASALALTSITTLTPVGAATPDVTVRVENANDVPITEVVLIDNGTSVTQAASQPTTSDSDDEPVEFSSITINDGGAVVLDNFNVGNVASTNYNFPALSAGIRTWENGVATEVGAAGFEDAVDRVLSSLDLRDYLAYDGLNAEAQANAGHDFDVVFDSPLRNSDYILVSERLGNTFFDLIALDKDGNVLAGGDVVRFDASYRWNTGFAPSNEPTQPMWFSVADVQIFNVDTAESPIYGFRVENDGEADVKFFGLSPEPFSPAMSLEKTVYAGHNSGASCSTSGELVTVVNGSDVTFCFSIINNGEARLDDLTITDADLGLTNVAADDVGTFTVLSGALPLGAGETMVIAYEAVADGAVVNTATATADVLLGNGSVNTVLSPETDTDTAEIAIADPASISGSVVDQDDGPISGVTITLSGPSSASTTTGTDGSYSFTGLAAGEYTVTETQPAGYEDGAETVGTVGGTSTGDASVNDVISGIVLAAGDDSINNDFAETIIPNPASISGSVVDNKGDPISGVTITLSGPSSASTTTGTDGSYSFTGLAAGEYTVTETQPAGYEDGAETVGTVGGTSTGDASVNDVISGIVLAAGDDSINNDFAERVPATASISGKVVDQNGRPIAGVTVVLSGAASATTTTATDGTYSFTGLEAGNYTVTETTPAGYTDGGEAAGSTGGTVTDDVIAEIVLAAGVASVNNDFAETVAAVNPALPATGSETPLVVAYGLVFIVSGAILTLTASQFGRRRQNI